LLKPHIAKVHRHSRPLATENIPRPRLAHPNNRKNTRVLCNIRCSFLTTLLQCVFEPLYRIEVDCNLHEIRRRSASERTRVGEGIQRPRLQAIGDPGPLNQGQVVGEIVIHVEGKWFAGFGMFGGVGDHGCDFGRGRHCESGR
jgi:hypothetical protein